MSLVLLVRHGQASFGASDYDELSDLGAEQSEALGRALAARGLRPDRLVSGGMRRHRQSLDHVVRGAGWSVEPEVDHGWDEFDHEHVIERHQPGAAASTQVSEDFQETFVAATTRWAGGGFDGDYEESFPAFGRRVGEAMDRACGSLVSGQTALVLTSGGPIAHLCAALLSPSRSCHGELWGRLNVTAVNTGVTKVVTGRSGRSLVSVNDHSHLETGAGLLSYR